MRSNRLTGTYLLGIEPVFVFEHDAAVVDDYLASGRRFTPDVDRRLIRSNDGEMTLEIRGPEGFLQAYEGSLRGAGIVAER